VKLTQPEVLISQDDLKRRVAELGREISDHYRDADSMPILVSVLKGSSIFLADLIRALDIDVRIDFMSISSYGDGSSSGVVRIVKDLEESIENRHVLVVEDIVDTGLTLNYLRRTLGSRGPASLRAVTLLDKAVRRIIPVDLEWAGFEIPDVFVLGYGLDHNGIYRNVRYIFATDDITSLVADPDMYVPALFASHGGPRPL
jgi:hypoxanthine phosphoribosyltransferase